MVSSARIEGGAQILSPGVRRTIQSIKEIVVNHSDADIYVALKDANMDPNETAQKLLNQDPFHEVKRKRDKRKESTSHKGSTAAEPRKQTEHLGQGMKPSTYSDRNFRRGGYSRNGLPDTRVSREFRIVRDNRVNQTTNRETKPHSVQTSMPRNEPVISNASEKSLTGISINQNPPVGRHAFKYYNGPVDSHPRQARDVISSGTDKELPEERQSLVPNPSLQMQAVKPNDFQPHSTMPLNNSVVGVYSSSSDPVHVPSPDSKTAANVGTIKREVGVVGARRQPCENSSKISSGQTSSFSNSHFGRDGTSRDSFRTSTANSKGDQPSQTAVSESAISSMSVSRSVLNNPYSSRPHQPPVGHQKAPQPNKQWKPKSSQRTSVIGPGVIGTPAKSVSPAKSVPPPGDISKDLETEAAQSQDKLQRINISENQNMNVIIAAHIRVSETDRCRLTFGSLGTEFESSRNSGFQAVVGAEESNVEPSASLSVSTPESSGEEISCSKQVDLVDDHVPNSGSNSPASGDAFEHQLADNKESSSPQDLDDYADMGLVRDTSPSYTPLESQQQQDPLELPSFSAYDPQTGYDIPYFRPTVEESVRGQGLPSPHEALISHMVNSIPASTVAMVQQQPLPQMYPQVHVSHFANLMPYRQFISPVYVPPMPMPGYSSNPPYPHPSNGNSYLLMPGGSSHLTASGLKYGMQQFKAVPTGSPTGFGNFTNPTGYAINAPGVVASATGLEDSTRLKFKDGNLYVPNPQAETSEIWMNPRDLPGLQSASYYNMPAQNPHAAYLPSHTSHTSFNPAAAVAQSSHMQFPGLYHPPPPPQPAAAAMANPHHMGPAMGGGNVGAGASGGQLGAYQQPQLGHLNWTTAGNF